LIAGKVLGSGRRQAILMFECFILIGTLFTMVQSLFTLCLGRLICGISGGVLSVVMSISMNETVPKEMSGSFGAMTNLYIVVGLLFSAAMGGVLPTDPELYVADENWRIIYGIPAIISMVQIAVFLVHFTEEPLLFSIGKGDDVQAALMISKLFGVPNAKNQNDKTAAYQRYIDYLRENSTSDASTVTLKDALLHPQYRKATWICFILGVFNMQTGIEAINVYFTLLAQTMVDFGNFPLTANNANTVNQLGTLAGCLISVYTVNALGRKTNLIIG